MPIRKTLAATVLLAPLFVALPVRADDAPDAAPEAWSVHGQATIVEQYHPAFTSPYMGKNSLDPKSLGDETFDTTLFAGVRLWDGGEAYINPEVDQGFGLSDTIGVAGFPSGKAYKIGSVAPYFRLQRLFFRQSFDLGGDEQKVESGANQLAGSHTANSLVITAGKIAVTDIFDANTYAHDPKHDFLNWAIIDSGAYDYAADSWGYSYGIAAEWNQDWWTWRLGLFDLSRDPNQPALVRGFGQYELVTEGEERHTLFGQDGKAKLLLFMNRARMDSYNDAVNTALATGTLPDTALVRQPNLRPGGALNLEHGLTGDLGAFIRLRLNDGSQEAFEFTEINRALGAGLSLKGSAWGTTDDTLGAAFAINAMSQAAQRYFAAGGIGILIGDGRLPHYGTEDILESYYSAKLTDWPTGGLDYQFIANPAYNRDRGPVSVLGDGCTRNPETPENRQRNISRRRSLHRVTAGGCPRTGIRPD
jgi:high affinity Mn2+ porin